jgi:DNA-binding NarL/FixJ family response regulator
MTKRSYSTIVPTPAATPVGLELSQNGRRVVHVERDRLVAGERLTPRESEVAKLVLRGFNNKDIAQQLGLQVGTVKIHLHRIYRKLGVPNRMVFLLNTLSKKLS